MDNAGTIGNTVYSDTYYFVLNSLLKAVTTSNGRVKDCLFGRTYKNGLINSGNNRKSNAKTS